MFLHMDVQLSQPYLLKKQKQKQKQSYPYYVSPSV